MLRFRRQPVTSCEVGGDMGLEDDLKVLVGEMDRLHGSSHNDEKALIGESGMPDFVTAENGLQRHFSAKARVALTHVSKTLYDNHKAEFSVLEFDNFERVARQCVANLHAAGNFANFCAGGNAEAHAMLLADIKSQVAMQVNEYTHYFPAWTLGMERESPFLLGPVTFFTRDQWIDAVDFSEQVKDRYVNERDANHQWKALLKGALQKPSDRTPLPGLAGVLYKALSQCPSMLKVTIRGYEKDLSRKLAQMVCKTALDAVSLVFGGAEFFHQQALSDERLEPVGSDRLMESNGVLWLPGMSLGKRIPHLPYAKVKEALAGSANVLRAFEPVLAALVDPASHPHPKLAQRWATALDWFGEGQREMSDAVSLAKLGTALDVLSCVGKFGGIRDMVVHLVGVDPDKEVISGRNPKTLSQLIKGIYDDGRSRILHGTHYKRLKSFAQERQNAAFLARIVLIECALRLQNYKGDDLDKAFRTMPA